MILAGGAGESSAQQVLELDGDGVLGNGPDTLLAAIGDTIRVDGYFRGGPNLDAAQAVFCNPMGGLEYVRSFGGERPGLSWFDYGSYDSLSRCVLSGTIQDSQWPPGGAVQPFDLKSFLYTVLGSGSLIVSTGPSWIDSGCCQYTVDIGIGMTVEVPTTGVRSARWGELKKLFR